MPQAAIEVDGLTKRYGAAVAVDRVTFSVPRGALYGFLGPNGSGKTTTLGMLTGLIPADAGVARVAGAEAGVDRPEALARVGALVEEPAFYPHLDAAGNLGVVARLTRTPREAIPAAIARVGLQDAGRKPFRAYSQGMRRRLGLAAAILPDPEVLILDEPANGLDPAGQMEMREIVQGFARAGKTVLLSSHLLREVQAVCSHVAVLHQGRLVADGPLDALLGAAEVAVEVDDVDRALLALAGLDGVRGVRADGRALRVQADPALAATINRRLVERGVAVSALSRSRLDLEAKFREWTEGSA
ncbi:MAG TPA: ATP-binding cassette domain-containing protein [Candidatus Thermoplasmatota archaeon]|nr:ATP-binding cassette domain-containing protein [Candidatus Thermoplasmatota archaeon]